MPNISAAEEGMDLSFEERINERKKIMKRFLFTFVGIPFVGTLVIILIIIGLSYVKDDTGMIKNITLFFSYAAAFSILWLLGGLYRYIVYRTKLPKIIK